MIKCPRCGEEFIQGGDFDYEDYGYEGDGIVSNMSCRTDWCQAEILLMMPEPKNKEFVEPNG